MQETCVGRTHDGKGGPNGPTGFLTLSGEEWPPRNPNMIDKNEGATLIIIVSLFKPLLLHFLNYNWTSKIISDAINKCCGCAVACLTAKGQVRGSNADLGSRAYFKKNLSLDILAEKFLTRPLENSDNIFSHRPFFRIF